MPVAQRRGAVDVRATATPSGEEVEDAEAAAHGRYLGTSHARDVRRRLASDAAAAQRSRDGLRAPTPWREFARRLVQSLRLMVGVHDYDQYLAHMRLAHPGVEPLTHEAFHRRCIDARYGGGGAQATGRCPC